MIKIIEVVISCAVKRKYTFQTYNNIYSRLVPGQIELEDVPLLEPYHIIMLVETYLIN